jgi:hypothetical protein
MGVERSHFVDFDQRQPHLLGEGGEMARVQAAEMVLQQVEMLDQKVATAVAVTEQRLNLSERGRIDLPALRVIGAATSPRARMDAAVVL